MGNLLFLTVFWKIVPKALGSFEEFILGAPFFQVAGNSSIGVIFGVLSF